MMVAKSWKAPGEDGLPAIVWKMTWPTVKHRVLDLFQSSLEEGTLPIQWRHAKIIPLKKPNKENYTIAKAWRPISLLATLGKILESVVAERISHAVETYGLLPTSHFGARKQRSAEQALVLLQEQIYAAWRGRRVVSLISFDVKGAYNGVCKERLLQRMKARGIPEDLLRWVEAFCSERTATIQINGQLSEIHSLPQAGLPQGSPLSPILFLFFNADLVQRQIDSQGGAIAFVDDFTGWVTGPSAQSNREGTEAIINEALDWEKRSGATFEADKTAIIHFTPKAYKSDRGPFTIKGQTVEPKDHVKILGVLMDTSLKYKEHIARAASKGLEAVMELRRLRCLSPSTARQLFTSTVAPVVDYTSNAILGTFLTVATSVAEAEAHIATAQHRFWRRAVKMWTDLHTLPDTNPLRRNTARIRKFRRFHKAAALTIQNPRQQSGQEFVCQTYKLMDRLQKKGNHIKVLWVPAGEDNKLLGLAKEQARAATHEDAIPQARVSRMKSTTLNLARSQAVTTKALPEDVGRHVKRVDAALPGKHTRQLYVGLSRKEATVLAQLRTGMAKFIWVSLPDQCRADRPVCMRTSK
ncbi:RNA-directed DNA polymerase from mobile element jockey [Aspergillus awamori]|uniref:RNA-directed DNA polymerase from mobile element jockey n=1 Tax=Aspergillus awamori TaxID=105351 RepID=A0A401L2W1_ASPAW|nr:RNA-directed DNA polymerase from mobile element jockey [Aspergillus awamori]